MSPARIGPARISTDRPAAASPWSPLVLSAFEPSPTLIRPVIEALRGANGALDAVFYDVPGLIEGLALRGIMLRNDPSDGDGPNADPSSGPGAGPTAGDGPRDAGAAVISLDSLRDPEGALLVIDPDRAPYITRCATLAEFVALAPEITGHTLSLTGVGSSALGSAAFAWDLAQSLGERVVAIVPGYGLADVVNQSLGGWFGYGLHDWLATKPAVQQTLAWWWPEGARIGRRLSSSATDTLAFRHGSGSADVLHALLAQTPGRWRRLVGHSKGALQIGNALRSLDNDSVNGLEVVTLGCPIAEERKAKARGGVRYWQVLGSFDTLGQLNAWGHWPEHWVATWHSTNPLLPPAMAAGPLTEGAA